MTPAARRELEEGMHQARVALKAGRLLDARRGLLKAAKAIEKYAAKYGEKEHANKLN